MLEPQGAPRKEQAREFLDVRIEDHWSVRAGEYIRINSNPVVKKTDGNSTVNKAVKAFNFPFSCRPIFSAVSAFPQSTTSGMLLIFLITH